MSVEGKKIKIQIGQIKEAVDGLDSANRESLRDSARLLLIAEMCQRGVVTPLDADDEKLSQAVIKTAGKMLLDENQVKPPLIAGAAFITSMVAQKTADIIASSSSNEIFSKKEWESPMKRCRDVEDSRLLNLLELFTFTDDNICNGTLTNGDGMKVLLLRVAYGNNLRACKFTDPSVPPMFKKTLDVCIDLQNILLRLRSKLNNDDEDSSLLVEGEHNAYYTPDTRLPLERLIAIAESKNNKKRAAELQLREAQSYLPHQSATVVKDILSAEGKQRWDNIQSTFIDGYINIGKKNEVPVVELLSKAIELVNDIEDTLVTDDNLLLHKILKAALGIHYENEIAETIAEKKYQESRNRVGLGSKRSTRSDFVELATRQLVSDTLVADDLDDYSRHYDPKTLDKNCFDLCKHFLQYYGKSQALDLQVESSLVMKKYIERTVSKARYLASHRLKKKQELSSNVWKELFDFISLILTEFIVGKSSEDISSQIEKGTSALNELLITAAESLFIFLWMVPQISIECVSFSFITSTSNFFELVLKRSKELKVLREKKRKETEGNILRSTSATGNKGEVRLEMCSQVARCHLLLSSIGSEKDITQKEKDAILQISSETVKLATSESKSRDIAELNSKLGLFFMQMLSTWSGLHASPWTLCNISQARSVISYVRSNVKETAKEWGRKLTSEEETILDIAEADSESGVLPGGMRMISSKLYDAVLQKLILKSDPFNELLKSHCLTALTRGKLLDTDFDIEESDTQSLEDQLKCITNKLYTFISTMQPSTQNFYFWRFETSLINSTGYHISLNNQLIADLLLHASKAEEAKDFLLEAIRSSPKNYDVAFAYGSFLLRMALFVNGCNDKKMLKSAQLQLLKAAKLDVNKADPFALLGLWYEIQSDMKRSTGCYSKALLLDPSHPVAGRGMLRINTNTSLSKILDNAMNIGLFQNGWAWKAYGDTKTYTEGDDEKAVICYQQALRASDISNPRQIGLNIFFSLPKSTGNDCSATWVSLGGCYRRLGKHSASVRAFQHAFDIDGNDKSYFCSWGQVELELGLLEQATEKFENVLHSKSTIDRYNAAYGLASCMLVFARTAVEEGKFGDALSHLRKGIDALESMEITKSQLNFNCALKLLGDLMSFGYTLPASTFASEKVLDVDAEKLKFVGSATTAYEAIIIKLDGVFTGNLSEIRRTAFIDLGINFLLQARLSLSPLQSSTTESNDFNKGQDHIESSIHYFLQAVEIDPTNPLGWVGLGNAYLFKDKILAQHAFCRALQLDKGTEDAWANMGLLYIDHGEYSKSEEAVDNLTQVSESSIMWVLRGLLLSNCFDGNGSSQNICRSADSFRAALQISRHRGGLLGLALSCRRVGVLEDPKEGENPYFKRRSDISIRESMANLEMYLHDVGKQDVYSEVLLGLMKCERGDLLRNRLVSLNIDAELSAEGIQHLLEAKEFMTTEKTYDVEFENILQKSLDIAQTIASTDDVTLAQESNHDIHKARQHVIDNPGDGVYWLQLSEALIQAMSHDISDETLTLVKSSINKTKEIMFFHTTHLSLLHPPLNSITNVHDSVVQTILPSSCFSRALALSFWIDDISEKENSNFDTFDLQRAMILDPENFVGRNAFIL